MPSRWHCDARARYDCATRKAEAICRVVLRPALSFVTTRRRRKARYGESRVRRNDGSGNVGYSRQTSLLARLITTMATNGSLRESRYCRGGAKPMSLLCAGAQAWLEVADDAANRVACTGGRATILPATLH